MAMQDTSYLNLMQVSGDDALNFLQGQLSNDLNSLKDNWQWQGYCTPKGRLFALFQAWKDHDNFYFLVDKDIAESTLKRLRMYVLRSKVEISLREDVNIVADLDPENPRDEGLVSIEGQQHKLHFNSRDLIIDFSQSLQAAPGFDHWDLCIEEGKPHLHVETQEEFVPQMMNLDLLDGINFKKGCYTGQEIVARMHYLGKLKQRMFVLESDNIDTVQIAEKIFNQDNKNIGSVAALGKHTNKLLAVMRIEDLNSSSSLTTESSCSLKMASKQPYSLDS